MRFFAILITLVACFAMSGCDGDHEGKPGVEVKGTPDLDPRTDHDIDVKTPDVDVDVHRKPGELPDVDVDVLKTPDKDTKANEP